jgi:phosphatidylglycerol:prolipoprotein diacylglycerol transferase
VGEYLLLTGAARFLVEFIRRNPKVILGLSNAQLASLGSAAAGLLLMWLAGRRKPEEPVELAKVA